MTVTKTEDTTTQASAPRPRLWQYYIQTVRPKLMQEFGLTNVHAAPRLQKIVLNVGLGEAPKNAKLLDTVVEELAVITGQRPVVTKARKAISNFSLMCALIAVELISKKSQVHRPETCP